MKKKLLAILAATAVVSSLGALAACGGGNDDAGHKHVYDATKWANDSTNHWNECTADGCDDKQQNKAAHDTNGANGACSVCGYVAKSAEQQLLDGYFTFAFETDNNGTQIRFFHFYEDTVFFGAGDTDTGSINGKSAHKYSVEKKNYTYTVWTDREERVQDKGANSEAHALKGTAEYTITLTKFDGSASYTIGYDGSYIYVGEDTGFVNGFTDHAQMRFDHDATGKGPYSSFCAKEANAGITVQALFVKDDEEEYGYNPAKFLEIYHNGSYLENVSDEDGTTGKWTSTAGDGTTTFTLTPDDTAKKTVTLAVAANGTATYTPAGGTAVDMVPEPSFEPVLVLNGTASGYTMLNDTPTKIDIPTALNFYMIGDVMEWDIVLTMTTDSGLSDAVIAKGTYDVDFSGGMDKLKYVLTVTESDYLEVGSTLDAPYTMNMQTMQVTAASFTLPAITSLGIATETQLILLNEVCRFTCGYGDLVMYNDNTCKFLIGGGAAVVSGTYTTEPNQILQGAELPISVTLEGNEAIAVQTKFDDGVYLLIAYEDFVGPEDNHMGAINLKLVISPAE